MGRRLLRMNRERVVSAMAKALQECDRLERARDHVLCDSEARQQAEMVFNAMVKASMPKEAKRLDNGTWWGKTPNGEKMINRITVQL